MNSLPTCPQCACEYTYEDRGLLVCPECGHEWSVQVAGEVAEETRVWKDANGNDIYSDPRTLTLYEIMRIMSIPENWPIPENASEAFLRRVIGEGVPPLMVKRFFEQLIVKNEK